jgi:hypothetical protein
MHDELSALLRLNFTTLKDLVEYGIKPDGHPAGIQLFLFYWTKLFGKDEYIVKLPFMLMGTACIPLTHAIGKKMFSNSCGFLAATFVASTQYFIWYSQIIRPYSSGLFFSLLHTWFFLKIWENKASKVDFTVYVFTGLLCFYTHYFSMLFAITLFIFLCIKNRIIVKTLLPYISIGAILYLPHTTLFCEHFFKNKGLEWLGRPTAMFPIEYFKYVFQYQPLIYILLVVLVVYGVYKSMKWNIYRSLCLIIGFTPMLLGVAYSILVKPVIQYSMLIFTFPFLLYLIFSWLHLNFKGNAIVVISILTINIYSLFEKRDHFSVLINQPFNKIVEHTHQAIKENEINRKTTKIYLGGKIQMVAHYQEKFNRSFKFTSVHKNGYRKPVFRDSLEHVETDYIICANIDLECVNLIRKHYPCMEKYQSGFNYEWFMFSKDSCSQQPKEYKSISFYDYTKDSTLWTYNKELVNSEGIYQYKNDEVYGPTCSLKLNNYFLNRYGVIDLSFDFKSKGNNAGKLILEIWKSGKKINWVEYDVNEYFTKKSIWQTASFSSRVADWIKSKYINDYSVRIYHWNPSREQIDLKNIHIILRKSSETIYALVEEI